MVNSARSIGMMPGGDVPIRIPHLHRRDAGAAFPLATESLEATSPNKPSSSGGAGRQAYASLRQDSVASILAAAATSTASARVTPSVSATASGQAATKAATPTPAPALTGDAAVVQSLKDALAAAGVNVEELGLNIHNDVERYPGGTYLNRYIAVDTPYGSAGLMTDLVALDPKIAVLDIKRMLGQA